MLELSVSDLSSCVYKDLISVETSAEAYKEAMAKRAERLKKEQFVKEKRLKEVTILSFIYLKSFALYPISL